MMTDSRKQARLDAIGKAIRTMKVGFCGIKFDCMVWRVTADKFIVGRDSISQHEMAFDFDDAVRLIDNLTLTTTNR